MVSITALTRYDIASYIDTLIDIYSLLILIYLLVNLLLSAGVRIPYSRYSSAVLDFLRRVSEPYLRIFRRFIPPVGPLDLSPVVALIVLRIANALVVNLIA